MRRNQNMRHQLFTHSFLTFIMYPVKKYENIDQKKNFTYFYFKTGYS